MSATKDHDNKAKALPETGNEIAARITQRYLADYSQH